MDGEEIVHSVESIPEGAIVTGVVEVVGYVRPDGEMGYTARWDAPVVGSMIGLVHMAIHDALVDRDVEDGTLDGEGNS